MKKYFEGTFVRFLSWPKTILFGNQFHVLNEQVIIAHAVIARSVFCDEAIQALTLIFALSFKSFNVKAWIASSQKALLAMTA